MKTIGLTGGIGTGKSTVAGLLRAKGYPVIDADQIARRVVEPGQPGLTQIIAAFGPDYLLPDGTLDRRRMGMAAFQNPELRHTLEQITHPLIAQETAKQLKMAANLGHAVAFYDAPLLFEAGRTKAVDAVVVVATAVETQIARVRERDKLPLEEIHRRINAQWPLDDKIRAANYVIHNDAGLEALANEVDRMLVEMNIGPPPTPGH